MNLVKEIIQILFHGLKRLINMNYDSSSIMLLILAKFESMSGFLLSKDTKLNDCFLPAIQASLHPNRPFSMPQPIR